MTGMPWQMSYSASADLDNSELQTDVMRFMAILAFCLVAIFAIVQTMPMEPLRQVPQLVSDVPLPPAEIPALPAVAEQFSVPVAEPERPKPARPATMQVRPAAITDPQQPTPAPDPVHRAAVSASRAPVSPAHRPVPTPSSIPPTEPVQQIAAPALPPVHSEPAPAASEPTARQGLSLAFESDAVLRSLVERNQVGLYAIDGKRFFAMTVAANRIGFSLGSAPAEYHEMVFETVPQEVAQTFESQQSAAARDVVWGVTLPPGTTRQLRRFVQTNFNGNLVITGDAQLALAGSS